MGLTCGRFKSTMVLTCACSNELIIKVKMNSFMNHVCIIITSLGKIDTFIVKGEIKNF